MIDEELYQFATDELNSDRRDSELWNRACALARDDHDEARFLYTNLRVEELLEQKANGEPMPEMPESVKGAASVAFDLDAAPNAVENAPLGLGSVVASEALNGDAEPEAVVSSSNRAFSASTSSDLSEDLIKELESSNQANASDDDALVPDFEQRAKNELDEANAAQDTLEFPDSVSDTNESSSIAGTETTLDMGDNAVNFDLDAAAALNGNESVHDNNPALPEDALSDEALPDVDRDIASLAAQASQQLKGSATAGNEALEDALDDTVSLDNTPFNTDKLDSIAAETGAFESLDDTSINSIATPLPENAVPESTSLNESELAFLDASIDQGRDEVFTQQREVLHQKDALTEELERQADSLMPADNAVASTLDESDLAHGTLNIDSIDTRSANIDSVAETVDASKNQQMEAAADYDDSAIESLANQFSSSTDIDTNTDNNALAGGAIATTAAATAAVATTAAYANDQSSQISQDYSQPINTHVDDLNPSLDQTELLSGKGRTYRVFSRGPDDNRAVKRGVSWAALFFTLPWLVVKRMPLMAITYALFWVLSLAGLVITGLHWLDAPKEAQSTLMIWPLAFGALAFIGLIVLPFFLANRWHAGSLLKRDYEEIALVRAKGPRGAIDRIMQMAS